MDPLEVRERLGAILQDIFENPSLAARDELTAADVEAWDSLSHVNLIVAVEKEFKIRLTTAEVHNLNNIGDCIRLIQKQTA